MLRVYRGEDKHRESAHADAADLRQTDIGKTYQEGCGMLVALGDANKLRCEGEIPCADAFGVNSAHDSSEHVQAAADFDVKQPQGT